MTQTACRRQIDVDSLEDMQKLFGDFDQNIKILMEQTNTVITTQDSAINISGIQGDVDIAEAVIRQMKILLARGETVDRNRIHYAIALAKEGNAESIDELTRDVVAITHRGKPIRCKTLGQRQYIKAIRENTVVFATGPAGTGKTYLAMAMAVAAYKNKEVEKIILTRPAVEAGEKLGFLPGDLQEKVDPYLRPLYDALYDLMGVEAYQRLVERGAIEVAPLAYMRGRTLSDSFIILDEAQNTTSEQMKMFLTRFGMGSRVVITGDATQIDLPAGKRSGLIEATQVLQDIPGIGIIELSARDVVRHELISAIVCAYERYDQKRGEPNGI